MLRTIAKIALIGWVGALLLLPLAGYALGFRSKNIENRTLAKGPGWSLRTLTHSGAWHRAADAFSDHMPLRDRAIRWRAETEFNVFHDSPRPDLVIVGRDGWLFLHEEFASCEVYPTITPMIVAQAFQLARAAASSSGRELYTMLIPAKSTIEADRYRSSHYSFESCPRAREQELRRLLHGSPGVIDLWDALSAVTRGGRDAWIPNDSHTDTAGSIAIARALVTAIRPSAWQEGLEQSGPASKVLGDLDVLAGIRASGSRHALEVRGTPRSPIREPLLALGDSQLLDAAPEIAPYFPSRQVLGLDGMLFGNVPRPIMSAAHLILVETVQRTAYQRVAAFLYPLPLMDAFLADIPRQPASYGTSEASPGTPLTVSAGVTNTAVHAARDDPRAWRLLIFTVREAAAPLNVALLDAHDRPRTNADAARGAQSAATVVPLAVPPGVRLRDVRLSIDAPAGAVLSPLELATLSRD